MPFVFIISTGGDDKVKPFVNLTSQVDGERTVFTTPENYETGTLAVYYNGIQQVKDVTYSESSVNTFTLTFTPQSGEYITVQYKQT